MTQYKFNCIISAIFLLSAPVELVYGQAIDTATFGKSLTNLSAAIDQQATILRSNSDALAASFSTHSVGHSYVVRSEGKIGSAAVADAMLRAPQIKFWQESTKNLRQILIS